MALGTAPENIFHLVVGQGLRLSGIGIAAGLIGAFLLTRLMRAMLVGVHPTDSATSAWWQFCFCWLRLWHRGCPRAALRHWIRQKPCGKNEI